jgi:hypothetical protein
VNSTFFVSDDISTHILFVVIVFHGIVGLCRHVVCIALSHILLFIVSVIIAPSQVHHDSVGYPSQLVLMPALKSITRFTLPKQPNLHDGQVTKDFLGSGNEFSNEWHLIKIFLRNLPVLDRINIFVLEFGARWKFQQRVTFIPPCDNIVGKFRNDRFVEVSIDEVLTREGAGQAS